MNIITFLSDFGTKSSYVAQMKGVANDIAPQVKCVDISHDISPYNIRMGAFILRSASPFFPQGTIHVAIVDPGVGTNRRGIVVVTKYQIFIGPDNGLLIPAAHEFGNYLVYEITNTELQRTLISNTFHGRDIFTPVAAHLLTGIPFHQIGPQIDDYIDLRLEPAIRVGERFDASVIFIDEFGNIITNVEYGQIQDLAQLGKELLLKFGKRKIRLIFTNSYGFVQPGKAIAIIGSSGYLEISINQGNAMQILNISQEDNFILDFSVNFNSID